MFWLFEAAGNPVHIMIVSKGIQRQIAIHAFRAKLPLQRISDFKIIVIHMARIQPFITFVIGR
jgi:hypothetical protein